MDGFIYRERLFDEEKMFTRIKATAQAKGYDETYRALAFMRDKHSGQFRKSGKHTEEAVPYINHPLMMACHACCLGVDDDVLLASILLHDVVEDTDTGVEELPFSDEVKAVVEKLSFSVPEGMEKEAAKKLYYERIKSDKKACMVKVIDRCNNVSTMAASFTREKLIEYVNETEHYVMPVLDVIRDNYREYADPAFLLKYQIISILETVKNLIG